MNTLKNIQIGLMSLLLIGLFSCDVDEVNLNVTSSETFWTDENDLKGAMNRLYTFDAEGYYNMQQESWSDNSYSTDSQDKDDLALNRGARSVPTDDVFYSNRYSLIRAANLIIENLPKFQGKLDNSKMKYYEAQARFFRAYAYFQLVQRYGNIVIIDKVLTDNSPELFNKQAPREDVYQLLYKDLDFAIVNLAKFSALGQDGYGLASQSAAMFLKAKAALFEGTRSKYHKYGTPNTHLQIAKDASLAIINSGEHTLDGDFKQHFMAARDGYGFGSENIWLYVIGLDQVNRKNLTNFPEQIQHHRWIPTRTLVESFLMKDGLPINLSPLYKMPATPTEEFVNRDLRMSGTFKKQGDESNIPDIYSDSTWHGKSGYTFQKFTQRQYWQSSAIDYPRFRYAEALLTFAEASYELTGSITDADLDKSINLLRKRAGIAPLTNAFIMAHPELTMLGEIRRERRVELAGEGHRYWDLIRWKTAETELPKAVEGRYIYSLYNDNEVKTLLRTSDGHVLVEKAEVRNFIPDRDYLFPLPTSQIIVSQGNLKQNPNWQ